MKTTAIPIARWTALVALFIIPFLPLYVANDLFFPFITGKGFAFRIFVEVAFGAWVLLALFDRTYRPRFSYVLAFFGALVAWMAVADAFGVNPLKAFWSNYERMDGWIVLVHVFAFFIVAGSVLTERKLWQKWWLTFIGASALVSIAALLQLLGAAQIHQGSARVDATFGNAAYFAAYLLFAVAITLWQARVMRGWWRYALCGLALVEAILIFETQTRGAILGLIGGAFVAVVLLAIDSGTEKRMRRLAVGAVAGLILVVAGFVAIKDTDFVQYDPVLSRIATISVKELSTRMTIWSMAAKGVMDDPLTGWGQEGFNQVFNTYYEPSMYEQESWFDRAHNTFLDWLVAGGIPAFILFLALLGSGVVALYRSSVTPLERSLLIAALAAYAIQALVVFDNLFTYVPLAAILAMVHGRVAQKVPFFEKHKELSEEQSSLVAPVAIVVTVVLVWMVNAPGIRAANHLVYAISPLPQGPSENLMYFDKALKDGSFATQEIREQLGMYAGNLAQSSSVSNETKTQVIRLAIEELTKEVARAPEDARLRLQLANAYESAGDIEHALQELYTTIELSPKKQAILIHTGLLLIEQGQAEKGRAMLHAAYELDTSFLQIAAATAAGDILAGDVAAGKKLLIDTFGTATPDNDSVFYAYYKTKRHDDLIAVAKVRVASTNGSPDARYRLVRAYATAGRMVQAKDELLLVMAAHPETRATGEVLMKQLAAPTP